MVKEKKIAPKKQAKNEIEGYKTEEEIEKELELEAEERAGRA